MIHHLASPAFWVALGEIIMVNIVLSGDNAVVIALAARSLPRRQQKQAIIKKKRRGDRHPGGADDHRGRNFRAAVPE